MLFRQACKRGRRAWCRVQEPARQGSSDREGKVGWDYSGPGPSQAWKYGLTRPNPDGSFHGNLRRKGPPTQWAFSSSPVREP